MIYSFILTVSRLVKNLGSEIEDQVKKYKDRLADLKEAFQNHAIFEIEITTFKILGNVNHLGKNFLGSLALLKC